MAEADSGTPINDGDLGRAAAEAILASGTGDATFVEKLTPEFARAAPDVLSDFIASQGFVRQMMDGATRGASQLNINAAVDPSTDLGPPSKTLTIVSR